MNPHALLNPVLLLFLLLAPPASSNSFGRPGICDAHADFGCTSWNLDDDGNVDRLSCADEMPGLMPWATRPIRTDAFSVTASSSSYVPDGQFLSVYVNTLDYDLKYRGILLHAVDSSGASVGEMIFPDVENAKFHSPHPECPHAALHSDAGLKPFKARFRFKTPPAGTGPITFRCLIKTGPANTGDFWYPNVAGDVTLQEAAPLPAPSASWLMSKPKQSCHSVCKKAGLSCDLQAMQSISSADALVDALGSTYLGDCQFPFLSDCSPVSPTRSKSGECYYHDTDCADHNLCYSKGMDDNNGYRFCACSEDDGNEVDGERRRLEAANDSYDAAAFPYSKYMVLVSLLPLALLASSSLSSNNKAQQPTLSHHCKRSGAPFAPNTTITLCTILLCLLIVFPSPTHAHNWIHTPGRASTEASTTKPCRGRKSSDTHAQVGPGQTYSVKWATGHSGFSMLLTVKDEHEHWLKHANLNEMVEDYIDSAPKNLAASGQPFRKYHGLKKEPRDPEFFTEQLQSGGLYKRELTEGNSVFDKTNHYKAPTHQLFEYNNNVHGEDGDKFAMYKSAKYPWIDSAGLFKHSTHRPTDWDAALLKISGRSGPGHYITFWGWRGYYDCTDVNYHSSKVPEEEIYGVSSGEYTFSRLDHCEYVEPQDIVTKCFLLETTSSTADECLNKVENTLNKNQRNKYRLGANVVPLKNPPAVAFDTSNIPWLNPTCVTGHEDLQVATDPMTHSAVTFSSWSKTQHDNKKCPDADVIFTKTATLREAILECSDVTCGSISVAKGFTAGNSLYGDTTQYEFKGCSPGATLEAEAGTFTYSKPASLQSVPDYANLAAQSSVVLSFGKADANDISDNVNEGGDKTYYDNGAVFTTHHDGVYGEYGWNCDTSTNTYMVTDKNNGQNGAANPLSFVRNFHTDCPDGNKRAWEMTVSNGVYRVTSGSERGGTRMELRGCSVENVKFLSSEDGRLLDSVVGVGATRTRIVEVTDGRLSLDGGTGCYAQGVCDRCMFLNDIKIEKLGAELVDIWFPAANNPVAKLTFDNAGNSKGVGLVKISLPDAEAPNPRHVNDDRSWLFYRGHKLRADEREKGTFGGATKNEGGEVMVYDGNTLVGSCGGAIIDTTYCGYKVGYEWNRFDELCPIEVDCGGLVGDNVRVKLYGTDRIPDFKVDVFWDRAYVDLSKYSACYGVEARVQKDVEPEFIITDDPLDPKFYSSCWVREEIVDFLPPQGHAAPPTESPWKFDGVCVDCESWFANVNNSDSVSYIPVWAMKDDDEACMNCALFRQELEESNGILASMDTRSSQAWPWVIDYGNTTDSGGNIFGSELADMAVFAGAGVVALAGIVFAVMSLVKGFSGRSSSNKGREMMRGDAKNIQKAVVGGTQAKHRTFELSSKKKGVTLNRLKDSDLI
jgi:hypothetical protein